MIQSEGFVNFRIWPEGKRNEYIPVMYIEPFNERNQRAFGYDLLSEPNRQSSMLEARDNGQTTISGKIRLVQETEYNIQAGFLIFIPFYEKLLQLSNKEGQVNSFRGFVYSPFKMKDLINATLGSELRNINIQIYDGIDTIPKNLMYNSDSLSNANSKPLFEGANTLNLYGKVWTLKFSALPQFITAFESAKSLIVLISGLIISFLFSLAIFLFVNSRNTGKKLSDLLQSTGEGIFGIDNSLNCTFINTAALEMLGYNLSDCLSKNIHEFIHCKTEDGRICHTTDCPITKTISIEKNINTTEVIFERKDKTIFPAEYSSHPIKENGLRTGTVVTFNDITERKKYLQQIEGSLREKELLLREIHHRVKNNLQIISSLLNLQVGFSKDKLSNEILEESKNRVKSMALIHEKLYQTKNFSSLDIHEFIEELLKNLFNSYGIDSQTVKMELSVNNISFNADQAVYLGLIVNELVSNSLKHAFDIIPAGETDKKQRTLFIGVERESNNDYAIRIKDNGRGFPKSIDYKNTESLGLQLVMSLVKQLDGNISMNTENGTEFLIKFESNQNQ
jgi:PAS domain S-box-containing protein